MPYYHLKKKDLFERKRQREYVQWVGVEGEGEKNSSSC